MYIGGCQFDDNGPQNYSFWWTVSFSKVYSILQIWRANWWKWVIPTSYFYHLALQICKIDTALEYAITESHIVYSIKKYVQPRLYRCLNTYLLGTSSTALTMGSNSSYVLMWCCNHTIYYEPILRHIIWAGPSELGRQGVCSKS